MQLPISDKLKDMITRLDFLRNEVNNTLYKIRSLHIGISDFLPDESNIYLNDAVNLFKEKSIFKNISNENLEKQRLNLVSLMDKFQQDIKDTTELKIEEENLRLNQLQKEFNQQELDIKEQLDSENFKTNDDLTVNMYTLSKNKIPNKITELIINYFKEHNILYIVKNDKLRYLSQDDIRDDLVKHFENSLLRNDYKSFYLKSYIQSISYKIDQLKF